MKITPQSVWLPPSTGTPNLPLLSTGNGSGVKWGNSPVVTTAPAPVSASFPAGVMMDYAGSSAPTGWFLCNGASVSTTTYAALFAVIGYTYGGSGGSFNLPDLRDRTAIGAGSSYALGNTGGSSSTTLSISNMPSHNHAVNLNHGHGWNDPGHHHLIASISHSHGLPNLAHSHGANSSDPGAYGSFWGNGVGNSFKVGTSATGGIDAGRMSQTDTQLPGPLYTDTGATGTYASGDNTSNVGSVQDLTTSGAQPTTAIGSGTSFSNLPPYLALNKIIKT